MHKRIGFIASSTTPARLTLVSKQSWPLGNAAVAPHSSILPAYHEGAAGMSARVAQPAQGAGSLDRPASTMSAPLSSARWNGSAPIMPTIRVARSIVASSSGLTLRSAFTRPALSSRFTQSLSCSEWMMARRKCSASSRATSRTMPTTVCRCGSPPAPPQLPMMRGMRASRAARSMRRKSRFIAIRELTHLPEPR